MHPKQSQRGGVPLPPYRKSAHAEPLIEVVQRRTGATRAKILDAMRRKTPLTPEVERATRAIYADGSEIAISYPHFAAELASASSRIRRRRLAVSE